MKYDPPADDAVRHRRLGDGIFWAVAASIVFLAYVFVIKIASKADWLQAASAALINLLSLAALVVPMRWLLLRFAIGRSMRRQLLFHVASAPLFSLLWYWVLMVLIGLSSGATAVRFDVRPFVVEAATAWQLLQA